mgnify:CR=1 FL=1
MRFRVKISGGVRVRVRFWVRVRVKGRVGSKEGLELGWWR